MAYCPLVAGKRAETLLEMMLFEADFDAGLVAAAIDGQPAEPLTSIAWLFWHVGSQPGRAAELDFFGGSHSPASGWTSPYIDAHPIFTAADEAVTAMRIGVLRDLYRQRAAL